MRLEYALTIHEPRSPMLVAIQTKTTGPSHLTRADVTTALGIIQSRTGLGLALLSAKYCKDRADTAKAVTALQPLALQLWTNGDARRGITGNGTPKDRTEALAIRAMACLAVEEYCRTADTPGAKCRCGGRGVVEDATSREFTDQPGIKTCPRCHGTGLTPLPSSRVYKVIGRLTGASKSTYYAKWKLMYDLLVERCGIEDSLAREQYQRVTRVN